MKRKTYKILTAVPFVKYLLLAAGVEEFKICSQAYMDFEIDKIEKFASANPDVLITPKIAMRILKTQ